MATSTPAITKDPLVPSADESAGARRHGWNKWLLLAAAVVCYVLFAWVGGRMGITRTHGFNGSLLVSPGGTGNVVVAAVLMLACVVIGTLIAGTVRPDAGLFAAALGLMALSIAGQPVYTVLHDAGGERSIFLRLALELILLYVALGVGWFALDRLLRVGLLHPDSLRDGLADANRPVSVGWTALATQVAITGMVIVFMAQSEDKKQVLAAVAIGSFAGAFFPYWQRGADASGWYWTGPLLVGLSGYLIAFASPPPGLEIGRPGYAGEPGDLFAALARPLPLDYASVGPAAAILGYWMRRKSLRERQVATAAGHA